MSLPYSAIAAGASYKGQWGAVRTITAVLGPIHDPRIAYVYEGGSKKGECAMRTFCQWARERIEEQS